MYNSEKKTYTFIQIGHVGYKIFVKTEWKLLYGKNFDMEFGN